MKIGTKEHQFTHCPNCDTIMPDQLTKANIRMIVKKYKWKECKNGNYPQKNDLIIVKNNSLSKNERIYSYLLIAEDTVIWNVYDYKYAKAYQNDSYPGTRLSCRSITHLMIVDSIKCVKCGKY